MVPNPDVVVVCCGGGGLLAGVAAAVKLSGCERTRIYGVEPEGGEHLIKYYEVRCYSNTVKKILDRLELD